MLTFKKKMTEAVFNLVTERKGATDVVRSAPIRFASTWTPSDDHDAATKKYVDDNGSSTPQEQQNMIYYSTAGPKDGVTADGLTLDSAFGDLSLAVAAANAAAAEATPYVVYCSDDGEVNVDAILGLSGYVSLWAPNLNVTAEAIELTNHTAVTVRKFTGVVTMDNVAADAKAYFTCATTITGSLESTRFTNTYDVYVRTAAFVGHVSSAETDAKWHLECDTFLGYFTIGSGSQLSLHAKRLDLTDSVGQVTGTVYIDAELISPINLDSTVVDGNLYVRSNYTVTRDALTDWFTETQRTCMNYPMTHIYDTHDMQFEMVGSDPAVNSGVTVVVCRMSNFCLIQVDSIRFAEQNAGNAVRSTLEMTTLLRSATHDSSSYLMGVDDGTTLLCKATMSFEAPNAGLITIVPYSEVGVFSGVGELMLPGFCIVVNLP